VLVIVAATLLLLGVGGIAWGLAAGDDDIVRSNLGIVTGAILVGGIGVWMLVRYPKRRRR
jgi:hypothetical protein